MRIAILLLLALGAPHGCRCGAWPPGAFDDLDGDGNGDGEGNGDSDEASGIAHLTGANAGSDTRVCLGATAALGAATRSGITYVWEPATYLDATDIAQPTFSGAPAGDYIYSLTATDLVGRAHTTSVHVTVVAPPAATIVSDRNDLCALGVVDFSMAGVAASYAWDFENDGIIDAVTVDPSPYTYAANGPYMATLLAADADGCSTQLQQPIATCAQVPNLSWTAAAATAAEASGTVTLTLSTDLPVRTALVVPLTYGGNAIAADFSGLPATITLPAGASSVTLTLTIVDDALDEADETLVVTIGASPSSAVGATPAFTLTITDDDALPFVAIADAGFVSEGAATASFPVTLSTPSGQTVTVTYLALSGSATVGADFSPAMGTVTFMAGQTAQTIDVALLDDAIIEANEVFGVLLFAPANAALGSAAGTATILDDDGSVATIGIDDAIVSEGAGTAFITVWRAGPNGAAAGADFTTTDGSAFAVTDFVASGGTVMFAPGEVTKTIPITLVDDSTIEAVEAFTVDLSNPSGGNFVDAQAVVTLVDDDGPTTLSTSAVNISEAGGFAEVIVLRSGANSVSSSVDLATAPGSAIAPDDFTATSTTLTFIPGDISASMFVAIAQDLLNEIDETFTADLTNPTGAGISAAQSLITILDDDNLPGLALTDVFVGEGDGTATITVTLNTLSARVVTVAYATAPGTAGAGADYTTTGATLQFDPGDLVKTFDVTINPDAAVEANEHFFVTLGSETNAVLWTTQARVTIVDDDSATSDITIVSPIFAAENGGPARFTVLRSGDNSGAASVDFTTSDGTAIAVSDYVALPGSVSFSAGVAVQTIDVTLVDDAVVETDEAFTVDLSNPLGATNSVASAALTIIDDDGPTRFDARDGNAGEADGFAQVFVTRSGSNGAVSNVDYATAPGTATAADFGASAGNLQYGAGQIFNAAWVPLTSDALDEDDELFSLTLSNPTNAVLGTASAQETILDDDPMPVVTFTSPSQSVGEGSASATVTAHLSAISGRSVTVLYTVDPSSSASDPADYTVAPATLVFPAGTQDLTLTITLVADPNDEIDETLKIDLSSATNATLGAAVSHTLTILDDDVLPFVSIADPTPAFVSESAADVTFPVTLDVASGKTVTVAYTTSNGSAAAGQDYTLTANVLTFLPGQTTQNVVVPLTGDLAIEPNENFTVTLSAPTNALIGAGTAAVTLLDDDSLTTTVGIDDVIVSEGDGVATFTVWRSGSTLAASSVDYFTQNGTAMAGADFVPAGPLPVAFAPGETTQTVTITLVDDGAIEIPEAFTVELANAAGATIGDASGTGTIVDDDGPPQLSTSDLVVLEGDGFAAVVVLRSGDPSAVASIDYATATGTASAGDFSAASGNLVFIPGAFSETIFVSITNDLLDEDDEAFAVNLTNAVGAGAPMPPLANVTILDDDAPPRLSIVNTIVSESAASITLDVTLDAPSAKIVTVAANTLPGTATAGADYATTGVALTFNPLVTLQQVTVPLIGDGAVEANETFFVVLSAPANATFASNVAQVTIVDDDGAERFSIDDVFAAENGGNASFTVLRAGSNALARTVNYATVDGSAGPGDYTAATSSVGFAALQISAPIAIAITDDLLLEPATETFFVDLSGAGLTFSDNQGLGTIVDNEGPTTVTPNDATVAEAAGMVAVFVVRSGDNSVTSSVDFATNDGNATAPADYTATNGTLPYAVLQVLQTAWVPVANDVLDEANETFTVDLSNAIGAAIGAPSATVTITDDDATPSVEFTAATQSAGEGAGNVTVTAHLSAISGQIVTVNFAPNAISTASAADYTLAPLSGTLSFPPGSQDQAITISIVSDTTDEPNEDLRLDLSGPSNVTLGAQTTHTLTITDDDPLVVVSASAPAFVSESAALVTFTVSLNVASAKQVDVTYTTFDGSALAGQDYQFKTGLLTFNPGQTSQTVDVNLLGDVAPEGNETFVFDLSAPVNATIGAQANVTILDDDGPTTLGVDDPIVAEDAGTVTFTIWRAGPNGAASSVNYTTADGTALAGSDYTTTSGTANFVAGQVTATVVVPILDDGAVENPPIETFALDLIAPIVGASVADAQGLATIVDDDGPPGFTTADVTVGEAVGSASVSVFRTGDNSALATVDHATAAGTATAADFTAIPLTTLGFPAGTVSRTVFVAIANDALDENNESFNVNLSNAVGAALNVSQAIVTITDDDAPPTVNVANAIVGEAAGSLVLNATLSTASGLPISVSYTTVAGTATAGSDYTTTSAVLNFAAGVVSQPITVPILDLAAVEANETFFIVLSAPTNATIGSGTAQITIVDDDGPESFSIDDVVVAENGGPAVFTVIRSGANAAVRTVNYASANGTAIAGSDYTAAAPGANVAFAALQITSNIPIAITNDVAIEANELFSVTISGAGLTFSDAIGAGTIVDNDGPTSYAALDTSIIEAGGLVPVTILRSGDNSAAATVNYGMTAGTATAADFTASAGSVNYAPLAIVQTVWVPITSDALNEINETFTVDVTSPAGTSGTVTITDDDPVPTLSISDAFIGEGAGATTITVTLSTASGRTVTVDYAATDGSADASDYTLAAGTVTFLPGQTSRTIPVTMISDAVYEGTTNETFFVTLANPTNALISIATAQYTIVDDDGAPMFSVADAVVSEGGGSVVLTVVRSGATNAVHAVDYLTVNDTAGAADYTGVGSTLSFAVAEVTKTVTIDITQDLLLENLERFFFNLSNATGGAGISDAQANVFIADDDSPPTLTILDDSGREDDGQLALTIVRNGNPLGVASVNYTPAGVTATAGTDFDATVGLATFLSMQVMQTAYVTLFDDVLDEDDETLTVTLSGAAGAGIAGGPATATILDEDATPSFSIDDPVAVAEGAGASITFTVTMSAVAGRSFTVNYDTQQVIGTALAGSDYTAATSFVTFAPGQTTRPITINLLNDNVNEAIETFTTTLTSASNGATFSDANGVGTIDNDDAVGFTIDSPAAVSENAGTVTFTVTRTAATEQALSVTFTTVDGSATQPGDYTSAGNTLNFPAGAAGVTQTFNVTIVNDARNEATQTFLGRLVSATGGATVGADGTATINDDDAIVVSINTPAAFDEATAPGTLGFQVSLSTDSEQTVTVDYRTVDGTAVSTAGGDFTAVPITTLTYTPGQTLKTVNVSILQDTLDENSESFTVPLSNPTPAASVSISGVNGTGTGSITDEDPTPSFRIDDPAAAVTEGAGATISFNVVLSAVAGRAFTIEYLTVNGTATAGNDFSAVAATTINFPAGTTTVPVTINLINDGINEAQQSFIVRIQNPSNGALITDSDATGTIADDDAITFSIDSPSVAENVAGGTVTFTVTRSIGTEQALSVDYATENGTAVQPGDYTTRANTLAFAASGASAQLTFTVPIIDDNVYEGASETFGARLSNPTGGATISGTNPGVATITENEAVPTIQFTATTSSGGEATTPANLQLTLSGPSSTNVTVNYTVTGGTATGGGTDYTLAAGTATVTALATTTNVSPVIVNDPTAEVDETIIVTLTAGSAVGATIGTNNAHTFTIVDNDRSGPTVTQAAYLDTDSNGRIDHVRLTFNKNVTDSTFDGYDASGTPNDKLHPVTGVWLLAARTNVRLDTRDVIGNTGDGIDNDAILFLAFDEVSSGFDTAATPDLTVTAGSSLRETAGGLCYLYTNAATCSTQSSATIASGTVTEADLAPPLIMIASGISGTTPLTMVFSEAVDANAALGCSGTLTPAHFTYTNNAVGGATGLAAVGSWTDTNACDGRLDTAAFNANLAANDFSAAPPDRIAAVNATTIYDNAGNAMPTTTRNITGQVSPQVLLVTAYTATKIRITFTEAMDAGTGATGAANLANYTLTEDPVEAGCAGNGTDNITLTGTVVPVAGSGNATFELTTSAAQCSTTTYRLTVANAVVDQNDTLPIVDPKFGNFLGNELLRVVSAACTDTTHVRVTFNKPILTGGVGVVGRANDPLKFTFIPTLGAISAATLIGTDTIELTHATVQLGTSYNVIGSNGIDGDGFNDAPASNAIQDLTQTEVLQAQPRDRTAFFGCGAPVTTFTFPWASDPFGDGSDFGNLSDFNTKVYIGPNMLGDRATSFAYNGSGRAYLDFAINRDSTGNVHQNTSNPATYATFGHAANAALGVAACTQNSAARLTGCGPDNENGRGVFTVVDLNGARRLFAGGARTQASNDFDFAYFTNDADTLLNFFYVDMDADVGGNTNAMESLLGAGNRLFVGFARGPQRRPDYNRINFNGGAATTATNCGTADNCDASGQSIRLNIHVMEYFGRYIDGTRPLQGNGAHYVGVDSQTTYNNLIYAGNGGHPQTDRAGAIIRSSSLNPVACNEGTTGSCTTTAGWTLVTPSHAYWANGVSGSTGPHWSLELQKTYDLDPGDKAIPAFVQYGTRMYMARNVCRVAGYDATGSVSGGGGTGANYDGNRPGTWAADHGGSYTGCHDEAQPIATRHLSRRAQLWYCDPTLNAPNGDCDAGDWRVIDGGSGRVVDGYTDFKAAGFPENRTISMLMVNGGYLYVGFDGPNGIQVWRTNSVNPTTESTATSGWAQIGATGFDNPTNLLQIFSSISVVDAGTSYLYLSAGRLGYPVSIYRQTSP
ncbi:MAG: hypothetical protein IT381_12290 [Deltaproteobacteria bacterium]|nr:hypothetical protein [Deltaproteobacteria bacterium]